MTFIQSYPTFPRIYCPELFHCVCTRNESHYPNVHLCLSVFLFYQKLFFPIAKYPNITTIDHTFLLENHFLAFIKPVCVCSCVCVYIFPLSLKNTEASLLLSFFGHLYWLRGKMSVYYYYRKREK